MKKYYFGSIFAMIMAVITIALVAPLGDEKGYMIVIYGLRYIGQPRYFLKSTAKPKERKAEAETVVEGKKRRAKKAAKPKDETKSKKKDDRLTVEDITPFTGIDGKYIEYGDKYSAVVMSIPSVEFRFYTQTRQDNMIDRIFGGILRTAADEEIINLVKLDQPVIYDEFIMNEQKKLEELKEAYLNGIFNREELTVRVGIIQDRIEQLQDIDFRNKVYMPFHYLMFIYKDRQMLDTQIKNAISDFAAVNIDCHQLEGSELAVFLKYNYGMNFDERVAKEISPDQYMDWILPDEIKIGTRTVQYDDLITHNFIDAGFPPMQRRVEKSGFLRVVYFQGVVDVPHRLCIILHAPRQTHMQHQRFNIVRRHFQLLIDQFQRLLFIILLVQHIIRFLKVVIILGLLLPGKAIYARCHQHQRRHQHC